MNFNFLLFTKLKKTNLLFKNLSVNKYVKKYESDLIESCLNGRRI